MPEPLGQSQARPRQIQTRQRRIGLGFRQGASDSRQRCPQLFAVSFPGQKQGFETSQTTLQLGTFQRRPAIQSPLLQLNVSLPKLVDGLSVPVVRFDRRDLRSLVTSGVGQSEILRIFRNEQWLLPSRPVLVHPRRDVVLQVIGQLVQPDLAVSVRVCRATQTGRDKIGEHRTAKLGSGEPALVVAGRVEHVESRYAGLCQRLLKQVSEAVVKNARRPILPDSARIENQYFSTLLDLFVTIDVRNQIQDWDPGGIIQWIAVAHQQGWTALPIDHAVRTDEKDQDVIVREKPAVAGTSGPELLELPVQQRFPMAVWSFDPLVETHVAVLLENSFESLQILDGVSIRIQRCRVVDHRQSHERHGPGTEEHPRDEDHQHRHQRGGVDQQLDPFDRRRRDGLVLRALPMLFGAYRAFLFSLPPTGPLAAAAARSPRRRLISFVRWSIHRHYSAAKGSSIFPIKDTTREIVQSFAIQVPGGARVS